MIKEAKADNILLLDNDEGWSVPSGIVAMLLGSVLIYCCMFATGYYIYGDYNYAISITAVAIVSGGLLIKVWKKIKATIL